MKFGLAYNTAYHGTDPDLMAAAARHAEKCGFESFCMSEHIVMYPGAALPGYVPLPPDLAVADPLECLAYVAAATSTLLLGTAVLLPLVRRDRRVRPGQLVGSRRVRVGPSG